MPPQSPKIQESKNAQIRERVRTLRNQGKDIVNLASGELIGTLPAEIKMAVIYATNDACNLYPDTTGLLELRKILAEQSPLLSTGNYTPEQLVITAGAKTAILQTMMALLDPGDEVLIPTPVWSTYSAQVKLIGAQVREIRCREPDFDLDIDALSAAVTPQTRMLILNTPCNPTGRVWSDSTIGKVIELALEHDFWILWDACYAEIVFDDRPLPSPLRINLEAAEKTIVIGSFSKAYSIAGWRLGYAAAPPAIAKSLGAIQSRTTSGANALAQLAMLYVLSKDNNIASRIKSHVQNNRDLAWQRLQKLPLFRAIKPEGGFYIYADIVPEEYAEARARLIDNIDDVILDLIENAGVAVTPGSAFNDTRGARISLSVPTAELEEGLTRLERFFDR